MATVSETFSLIIEIIKRKLEPFGYRLKSSLNIFIIFI